MKSLKTKLPLLVALLAVAPTLASCGGGGGEPIDKTRTQLYVHNFQAGFGSTWLTNVKKDFEEAVKDISYEEGKKGAQIIISGDTKIWTGQDIVSDKATVFFAEMYNHSVPEFAKNGYLKNIDEVINTENEFDGNKKIIDKMKDSQKDYFEVNVSGNKNFYGVPHYYGSYVFNVNTKVFDEKCFYFKDGYDETEIDYPYGGDVEDLFISDLSQKKSAGPDGKYDTYDDGFPITFNEFFVLCDYMKSSVTPIAINNASFNEYAGQFAASLLGTLQGEDQYSMNFSFGDGAADPTLKDYIANPGGEPTSQTISLDNGYDMYRSNSRYKALNFMKTLFGKDEGMANWFQKSGVSSHTETQNTFISGSKTSGNKDIALLIDGTFWQNEAINTFNELKNRFGDEFDIMKRDYTIMPMPRASKSDSYCPTLTDEVVGAQFMSSDATPVEYTLGVQFLKFVNSDAQLSKFSKTTNTPRALRYTVSPEDLNETSLFGKHIMEIHNDEDSKVLFSYASNEKYSSNMSYFRPALLFDTDIEGGSTICAPGIFKEYGNKYTTAQLFENSYNRVKSKVWHK